MPRFNATSILTLALTTLAGLGLCATNTHAQTTYTTTTTTVAQPAQPVERYEVTPGHYQNQWVPPVYATALDSSGRPYTYVAQAGYSRQVYVEPTYAYRPVAAQTVYVQQTQATYIPQQTTVTYVAPAPAVYAPQPVVCAPPPPPVVYCPPPQPVIVCPPPRPVVFCPPPAAVYCPPPRPAVSISIGYRSGGFSGYCPPPRCEPVFRPRPYCPPPGPICYPTRSYPSGTSVSVNVNVRSRR